MPRILDVEAALLLLELEPPFDQRAVQLARRRMAKRWHPDIAPPGRRHEHQRHLQAINEAADELERLAESSRGGRVSRNAGRTPAAGRMRRSSATGRPPRTGPSMILSAPVCRIIRSCTAMRGVSPTRS